MKKKPIPHSFPKSPARNVSRETDRGTVAERGSRTPAEEDLDDIALDTELESAYYKPMAEEQLDASPHIFGKKRPGLCSLAEAICRVDEYVNIKQGERILPDHLRRELETLANKRRVRP